MGARYLSQIAKLRDRGSCTHRTFIICNGRRSRRSLLHSYRCSGASHFQLGNVGRMSKSTGKANA
jgi:hypothetical protein